MQLHISQPTKMAPLRTELTNITSTLQHSDQGISCGIDSCVWSGVSVGNQQALRYLHDAVISLQKQLVTVFTCVQKCTLLHVFIIIC